MEGESVPSRLPWCVNPFHAPCKKMCKKRSPSLHGTRTAWVYFWFTFPCYSVLHNWLHQSHIWVTLWVFATLYRGKIILISKCQLAEFPVLVRRCILLPYIALSDRILIRQLLLFPGKLYWSGSEQYKKYLFCLFFRRKLTSHLWEYNATKLKLAKLKAAKRDLS